MASFKTFESDVSEKQFMEAAVNSLLKEGDEFCDEVEKCFDESLLKSKLYGDTGQVRIKHGYGYGWPDTDTDVGIKHG